MFRLPLLAICLVATLHANAPKQVAGNTIPKKSESYKPFTGKVMANKVRLRVKPDLDGHILKQIDKNELLLVVGEQGDFYEVEAPKGTKAFVFRSYILDDRVEANRVNIRLEPNIDAPIIGQLKAGDQVKGTVCASNNKWLEIPAPKSTKFYVSKEYIVSAGNADHILTMEKRKTQVEDLLTTAFKLAEAECKKGYEEMEISVVTDKFQTILKSYPDFPEATLQAKEAIALLKETYLNKKIAFLEAKAELTPEAKEALLFKHRAESAELLPATTTPNPNLWNKKVAKKNATPSMHVWDTLEESLYLSWTAFHSGKKMDDFYLEQKVNASVLTGTVETYYDTIKDRPGDHLLSLGDGSFVYLYSTQVNLTDYVGKSVTILASPRPNNHFAFPAYYVLSVEDGAP